MAIARANKKANFMVTKRRGLEHKGPKAKPQRYVRTLTVPLEGGTPGRQGRLISKEWARTLRRSCQATLTNDTGRQRLRWYETPDHRHGKVVHRTKIHEEGSDRGTDGIETERPRIEPQAQ